MFECSELIHPFQNDPGVSQQQREMDDLLSASPKIDGRSMADLLDYFVKLSPHINYYDAGLNVSDWQPFFQKSIPFALTAIIKFNRNGVSKKIEEYNKTFNRHPSKAGLQLLLHYMFQKVISRINNWHLQLKNSGLPAELIIEKLIKDKLQEPLKKFACNNNVAVRYYCVKPVDFSKLAANEVWGLNLNIESVNEDCKTEGKSKRKRLIALGTQIKELLPSFLDAVRIISNTAEQSLEQSLFPLKEELQKKHTPHLALLFSFLKLFQHLQGDLNKYTKKHLDFFYKQVLKLNVRGAVPDKAHIVFEIQKQLDTYLLKKGLLVKDGKDTNKAEILFSLDDEIVVNKTQVADKRTLLINNQNIFEGTYVEGVYMAPNADKADGLTKDFKNSDFKSFATLGAKFSKYTDPEKTLVKPYPDARIGFILASPVLLLNEGTRNITITLACKLNGSCLGEKYPEFFSSELLYNKIRQLAGKGYYYISQDLISEALKKGTSKSTIDKLWKFLFNKTKQGCSEDEIIYDIERIITARNWWVNFYNALDESEKKILSEIFPQHRIFKIWFSGKDEWIEPSNIRKIKFSSLDTNTKQFTITIKTRLKPDKPAVTFYDKEKLKEDFSTTQPLVKVELDHDIKIFRGFDVPKTACCLQIKPSNAKRDVSFYHFFRDVRIIDKPGILETKIDVRVCGLKNFIVQNDESVQDVNGPMYPFGARPDVPDFTVETISKVYCITQELIDDAVTAGISNQTKNFLDSILGPKHSHRIKSQLEDFLDTIPNAGDKPILQGLFNNPAKKYCKLNLVGPDFYIGSKEVFCKRWNDVYININWKEKPVDFNEYYKAYWVDPTDFSKYGISEENFQINIAVLEGGAWKKEKDHALLNPPPPGTVLNPDTQDNNRPLFKNDILAPFCSQLNPVEQTIHVSTDFFSTYKPEFRLTGQEITKYLADTPFGFLKINLQNQDFLHKNYSFVLARQMMALGKFPKEFLEDATYLTAGGTVFVFENTAGNLVQLDTLINQTLNEATAARNASQTLNSRITTARNPASDGAEDITDTEFTTNPNINAPLQSTVTNAEDAFQKASQTKGKYTEIKNNLSIFDLATGKVVDKLAVLIPNEPWTPIIKNISLDYNATAAATDIDLIHLYPYDDTYKTEEITLEPTLFPTFCDEGTLFLGLKDLEPGSNVNMLFQLAEATADSESDRGDVIWHYLDNNQWKQLRTGFEVLEDATNGLTTSGIVEFALPENMTKDNTILPKDLHWIKATVPKNSTTISETIGIYTQAIRTTFTNAASNDKLRLSQPLGAGSISKLNEADANVKKLIQPFESFGGRVPEGQGHFYIRVSELLRHKGRAIQKFDYERLVLEAFPKIFKVKCISHSFSMNAHQYKNDFPMAPGYVLLAVIPDLNQLKAAKSYEPKAPVSMLDDIQEYCKKITSPFVRFRAMNPRYEKVHFCLTIKLIAGKDKNYYKEKLKQDLREFLAPWAIGEYQKLRFGQCLGRSDVIRFLETRDYVDYIIELLMRHDEDDWPDKAKEDQLIKPVCPKTPRSILIGGDIDVCIPERDCETWGECFEGENDERARVKCCDHEKIPIAEYCKDADVIG